MWRVDCGIFEFPIFPKLPMARERLAALRVLYRPVLYDHLLVCWYDCNSVKCRLYMYTESVHCNKYYSIIKG